MKTTTKRERIRFFVLQYTPFIILGFNLLLAFCSYFGFYKDWFKYLGDLVGYSIITDIFMLAYYFKSNFCTSTKISVVGLFVLNLLSIPLKAFKIDTIVYDIYIILVVIAIIIFLKHKK